MAHWHALILMWLLLVERFMFGNAVSYGSAVTSFLYSFVVDSPANRNHQHQHQQQQQYAIKQRQGRNIPVRASSRLLLATSPSSPSGGNRLHKSTSDEARPSSAGRRPNASQKNQQQQQQQQYRRLITAAPTGRSTATFALMEGSKRPSAIALRKLENDSNYLQLERRDRAFARLLLTTTERRHGQIDKVIQRFSRKQPSAGGKRASDFLCAAALRIGASQLLFMDTPAYAAIQETVEVLRMHPHIQVGTSQISFVNAVLRTISREGMDALLAETSVLDNVEPQLAEAWIQSYGEERTHQIIAASMEQSPIFVTVNHDYATTSPEERALQIEKVRSQFAATSVARVVEMAEGEGEDNDELENDGAAEVLPQGSIRVPEQQVPAVSKWPGYDKGEWWVQDPSATLPALALYQTLIGGGSGSGSGNNDDDRDDDDDDDRDDSKAIIQNMHVVDLCSAPGGKTAQLCSFGFGRVTAVELSQKRTKPLRDNLERLGRMDHHHHHCEIVVADGREWMPESDSMGVVDAVLLDAPCSATGLGSRRPDVLQKNPWDLGELLTTQRELAVHTVDDLLPIGGVLVYATCSLLQAESEDQMEWLLSRDNSHKTAAKMETIPFLPGDIPGFDEAIDEHGWLRVLPGQLTGTLQYCDGFFVARLRRMA